jgi:hypothetical protein
MPNDVCKQAINLVAKSNHKNPHNNVMQKKVWLDAIS